MGGWLSGRRVSAGGQKRSEGSPSVVWTVLGESNGRRTLHPGLHGIRVDVKMLREKRMVLCDNLVSLMPIVIGSISPKVSVVPTYSG